MTPLNDYTLKIIGLDNYNLDNRHRKEPKSSIIICNCFSQTKHSVDV